MESKAGHSLLMPVRISQMGNYFKPRPSAKPARPLWCRRECEAYLRSRRQPARPSNPSPAANAKVAGSGTTA